VGTASAHAAGDGSPTLADSVDLTDARNAEEIPRPATSGAGLRRPAGLGLERQALQPEDQFPAHRLQPLDQRPSLVEVASGRDLLSRSEAAAAAAVENADRRPQSL
jgi:hypothetical protein